MAMIVIGVFLSVLALIVWFSSRYRAQRNLRREAQLRFIETYVFPTALHQKLYAAFPALNTAQINLILDGLRQWFELLHRHRGQKFGMPSKAVDTAWHEFILMTRQYQAFCDGAFATYLHHAPNLGGGERSGEDLAVARTYALAPATATAAGGVAATGLFDIDRALGIEGGYVYDDAQRTEMMKRHADSQQLAVDGGGWVSTGSSPRDEQGGHSLDSDDASGGSSDGGGSGGDGGSGGSGCGGGGGCGGGCGS